MKELLLISVGALALAATPGGQRSVKLAAHKAQKTVKQITTGKPSKAGFLPPQLEAYRDLIERSSVANGIPFHIAAALVFTESSGRPNARARNPVPEWIKGNPKLDGARKTGWSDSDLSSAHGLAQVLGATAWDFGYRGSLAGLYVPAKNLEFGMRILHRYSKYRAGTDQLDSWRYPLMAYNAGPGGMQARKPDAVLYAAKVLDLAEKYLETNNL
jgi:soluble lytic murein transglycosylase-like protein